MAGAKRLYLSPYKAKKKRKKQVRKKSRWKGRRLVWTKETARANWEEGVGSHQSLVESSSGAGMDRAMAKDGGCQYWYRTLRNLQGSLSHGSFLRRFGAHIGAEGAGMHVRWWVDSVCRADEHILSVYASIGAGPHPSIMSAACA